MGPFVYISDFFEGVKVKFFRFLSKQIAYLVFLNTLVLESIKISWELLVYYFMKFKNSHYSGDLLYTFQFASINYEPSRRTCEKVAAPRGTAAHSREISGLSTYYTM